MGMKVFACLVSGPVLLSIVLSGCEGSPATPRSAGSESATHGELTQQEYAAAVGLARREARADEATITSATVTVSRGTVSDSNTGHPCESGRLLHVKLIGTFPHIVTTVGPLEPDSTAEDFTVHAVLLTADAESGRVCLKGVQTGDVAPEAGAAVLVLD